MSLLDEILYREREKDKKKLELSLNQLENVFRWGDSNDYDYSVYVSAINDVRDSLGIEIKPSKYVEDRPMPWSKRKKKL